MLALPLMLVLLLLSALFSGAETATFSLTETDRAALGDRPGGRRILRLLEAPARLLAALIIGNLLVNTLASVVGTATLVRWLGSRGMALAVPLLTLLLLLAGEITPKLLALQARERIALLVARPLAAWVRLIGPLLDVVDRGGEALLRRIPAPRSGSQPLTPEELSIATELAVADGVLAETEGRFVARLQLLGRLAVREIMTPRTEVVVVPPDGDRERILALARRTGFNRYPVMAEDGERPEGFLHLKDLLDPGMRPRIRPLPFVPESKPVRDLLTELRGGAGHMAGVVDEHGDYVGIVTLEDCLEALTGPWHDESDRETPDIFQLDEHRWIVAGSADLRSLNSVCGVRLPLDRGYVTVAGYMMDVLGRIPRRGDTHTGDGVHLTVLATEGHRVVRVALQRLRGEEQR